MEIIEIDGSIYSNLNKNISSTSIDLDSALSRKVILEINKIKNKVLFGLGYPTYLVITCGTMMLDILVTNTAFSFPPVSTSITFAGTLIGNDVYLDRYMDSYSLITTIPSEYNIKHKLESVLNDQDLLTFEYCIKVINYGV